jgi:hypothetical protein
VLKLEDEGFICGCIIFDACADVGVGMDLTTLEKTSAKLNAS